MSNVVDLTLYRNRRNAQQLGRALWALYAQHAQHSGHAAYARLMVPGQSETPRLA